MTISSETPGTIRYTLDGNEPDQSSPAYYEELIVPVSTTLKARVYPANTVWGPSDVEEKYFPEIDTSPIAVNDVLPDGSVIVLDRGSSYGEYGLFEGYPMRMSAGEDDGSVDSENWRYLIIDSNDTEMSIMWDGSGKMLNTIYEGYSGLYNTNLLIRDAITDNDLYVTYNAIKRRKETNLQWFIPSMKELEGINRHSNVDLINNYYWSSCEANSTSIWIRNPKTESVTTTYKTSREYLRLMRRI